MALNAYSLFINKLFITKKKRFVSFFFLANRSFCLNKVRQIENAKLMRIFQVCSPMIKKMVYLSSLLLMDYILTLKTIKY